jgi:hypothetical protein
VQATSKFGEEGSGKRMAIYTTFFLCKPTELPGGFPGWRPPLAEPVRREVRDPFTGELLVVETCVPEWPEDAAEEAELSYQVVEIEGSYEEYLENRLPPFVRGCPHWAAKGLTEIELAPLLAAVGVSASIDFPIYGPPSSGAIVQQLPAEFLAKATSLDQQTVAQEWAAAMSTPEHTHTVSGQKLYDGWTASEALELLQPLVDLARKASAGQQMYLLTEW